MRGVAYNLKGSVGAVTQDGLSAQQQEEMSESLEVTDVSWMAPFFQNIFCMLVEAELIARYLRYLKLSTISTVSLLMRTGCCTDGLFITISFVSLTLR